ncbi:rRNA pseudouridine synthase [Atopomonas sediminilitoris]|uniref:rRNA pseudouridine synthase n=1 Tax=Atopomonas sediminilitoris TaxID=2919919 RepID=UPI001F4D7E8E|nr:rRNA pseudouridine synthase [Atopomonas sediminilitoris]MCJ8168421.1 rRNA pseudouridine synthase [Atopomonas sediminilitoris]
MTDPVRLSKHLMALVGCSRREAELYIEGGWVTVDGVVVEQPHFKVLEHRVALLPDAVLTKPQPATLLLHAPANVTLEETMQLLTRANLSPAHRDMQRVLSSHLERQKPTLPLHVGAAGLLVFSQDWRTLRKLIDDARKLEQEYIVEVDGSMPDNGLKRLARGGTYQGYDLPPVKASWQSEQRLRFAFKDLRPGLLTQLCASVGLRIVSAKRIRIGGVAMGKLAQGQWRYCAPNERF